MWIRSQDRIGLINATNIYYEKIGSEHKINSVAEVSEHHLGTYKTKERALEVLDEIQVYVVGKILIPTDYSGYNFDDTSPVNGSVVMDKIEILPTVYNMPKE